MLFVDREEEVGARSGSVSRRYMRMKPRMRERPIQAWGVRWLVCLLSTGGCNEGEGEGDALEALVVSRMPILPGAVGVRGGSLESTFGKREESSGRTGPGIPTIGVFSDGSVSSVLERAESRGSICHRTSRGLGKMSLFRTWECVISLAL